MSKEIAKQAPVPVMQEVVVTPRPTAVSTLPEDIIIEDDILTLGVMSTYETFNKPLISNRSKIQQPKN